MHRLEIIGETPQALYFNAINLLSLLLGAPQTVVATPSAPQAETDVLAAGAVVEKHSTEGSSPSGADQSPRSEPLADEKTTLLPPKKRKAKPAESLVPDEIGDLGVKEATVLTLDGDIRPMLRAIQKACTERGMDMPACVGYVQKLYGPFGIAKAEQLKPEQFAEFMDAAEAYLKGEA